MTTTTTQTITLTGQKKGCIMPTLPTLKYTTGKTDQFTLIASEMAVIHNVWIKGWNSIYQQAPYILERDYTDFIQYCLAWHACLEVHHDGEEEDFFPKVEEAIGKKGFLSVAVDQHATFHDGLTRFHEYLLSSARNPRSFQPHTLIHIMDTFGPALHHHLAEEPLMLMKLSQFNFEAKAMWDKHGEESMGKCSAVSTLPFVWVNLDTTFEGGIWANWPPAPKAVVWVLRNVLSKWNSKVWRFGSTDLQGRPHQLLALRPTYKA